MGSTTQAHKARSPPPPPTPLPLAPPRTQLQNDNSPHRFLSTARITGLQVLPGLSADARATIYSLFDTYVDAGLTWLSQHGQEFISAVENNRTTSLSLMMQSLMMPERGFKTDVKPEQARPRLYSSYHLHAPQY